MKRKPLLLLLLLITAAPLSMYATVTDTLSKKLNTVLDYPESQVAATSDDSLTDVWVHGCKPAVAVWTVDTAQPPYHVGDYASWTEGCGWYDCDKIIDWDLDSNLCWAAVCANLLHWWFDQNAEVIARYGDRYTGPKPTYRNCYWDDNQTVKAVNMSSLFDWYKSGYGNSAGSIHVGIDHFLSTKTLPHRGGAFFSDVFPESNDYFVKVVSVNGAAHGNIKKQMLAEAVKSAIANRQAIGLSVKIGTGHAMTVWGASLDRDGYVARLFVCDNNADYSGDINAMNVIYDDEDYAYLRVLSCNIFSVSLFGLGEDYWNNYFAGVSDVESVDAVPLKVGSDGLTVVVDNCLQPVRVWNMMGELVGTGSESPQCRIAVPSSGMYVVKTGDRSVKIVVR